MHQGGTASGLGATAFGSGTWAEGTLSTAWGSGTGASGENATAWGYMTQATAAQATSWGVNTSAGAAHATAWGNSTTASGEASTAFGIDTTASGMAATAFGYVGTKESGYDAPSIKATEIGTTAYGYATLGGTISAEGGGSTAFGSATMGGKISAGTGGGPNDKEGATAFGRAYGEKGQISATEMGATAFGAASDGTIKAEEWGATAFGRTYDDGTISASGRGATAFGYAENGGSISASGRGATAFGYASGEDSKITASGIGSTAFGNDTTASGIDSTAFGINTAATGTGAVAWGVGEKGTDVTVASGESSTAFGKSSQAWGDNSLAALGGRTGRGGIITDSAGNFKAAVLIDTNYNAVGAVAIGEGAVAEASHTYAIGKNAKVEEYTTENAIAFGNDSSVTEAGGVALGSKAVASVAAGVAGYDPATKAESTDTSGAWQSTHAAVSIGTADGSVTRQITGVAAGSKDTDAVNVAQLKAVAEADTDTKVTGGSVDYSAGTLTLNTADKAGNKGADVVINGLKDDNTVTTVKDDGNGIVNVGDAPDAAGNHNYTVSVDTTKLKAAVADLDTNTTYQFETKAGDGSDNVVAKTTVKSSTDGVNYTETGETFSDTDTKITSVAVDAGTKDASGKTTYTVTLSDNNENKTDSKLKATFAVTDTNTQSTVKHADSSKDYLTVTSADNSIGTKDYTVALTDKANTAIGNANTFLNSSGFKAGNVTVTSDGFKVGDSGPSMTSEGIDAGNKKITNVADGTDSKDAVNYGQLQKVDQKISSQDDALRRLAHRDAQLERKIYRAGAHAAAIAALHPLDYDEDHKLTAAAGVGQYHGSSAMAVGAFYRPTENLMFSVGASLNENDSMVNAGMAYRFGTGSGNKTSPDNIHEMKRQISTLSEENRQLSAQLSSSEAKLASSDAKILTLEEKIRRIEKMLKLK